MYEKDSILEREHARCNECCVLTKAVPRCNLGLDALCTQELGGNHRHREDGGLCMLRQLQPVGRSLEAELADRVPECIIRLGKALLCKIIGVEEVLPHANNLCPLSGEQKCEFSHSPAPHSQVLRAASSVPGRPLTMSSIISRTGLISESMPEISPIMTDPLSTSPSCVARCRLPTPSCSSSSCEAPAASISSYLRESLFCRTRAGQPSSDPLP